MIPHLRTPEEVQAAFLDFQSRSRKFEKGPGDMVLELYFNAYQPEDSEEQLYEEAEALRLKTPSPEPEEPPRKKRREKNAPVISGRSISPDVTQRKSKKEKKRKKEAKEGKEGSLIFGQATATGDESVASQHALAVCMANAHAAHAHACDAGDGCTVQDLRVQTRQAGAAMSPQITAAPTIPTLHSVMTGEVQLLTPKGALVALSDDSPQRPSDRMQRRRNPPIGYVEGLLRRRSDERPAILGAKLYVKVVRIEAGMVIVDSRGVDQDTGKDQDPEHDQAEVEEWIDVPVDLVGRIIGKKGERIRQICDDTGADLRFDGSAEAQHGPGANTKKTTGGAGDDMRKHQSPVDRGAEGQQEPKGGGDDLRAFLEEAKAGSATAASCEEEEQEDEDEAEDFAEDLAAFLQEVKNDSTGSTDPTPKGRRNFVPAVEFVAYSLENWDEMLYRKMGEAGVTLVYPENLTIIDKEGNAVEIAKGLRHRHFPIRVRYILTSDTYAPEKASRKDDTGPEEAVAEEPAEAAEAPSRRPNLLCMLITHAGITFVVMASAHLMLSRTFAK
eukprot:s8956_g1.t1